MKTSVPFIRSAVQTLAQRRRLAALIAGLLAVLGQTSLTWAQCEADGAQLLPADGDIGDQFGYSAAVSGDLAVLGAQNDDETGSSAGSAYIFRFDGTSWNQEEKLLASDPTSGAHFGNAVGASGEVVVVAAVDKVVGTGAAYAFRLNGGSWVQEQILLAPDGAFDDRFGASVAVSGDVAIVGAPRDDDDGANSGSAYVFRFNGSSWGQTHKLRAFDGSIWDKFGNSVAISGDVVVAGAPLDDDAGTDSGSAYVFRYNGSTWIQEQKLVAPDGATCAWFGDAVSVSGDVVVVGTPKDDDMGSDSGAAYVFRRQGGVWVFEGKLVASDGVAEAGFGSRVAASGGFAVIGAPLHFASLSDGGGAAYLFEYDGQSDWIGGRLVVPEVRFGDEFGQSVAVSGDAVLVGTWKDDDNGSMSGSAFAFGAGCDDPGCTTDAECDDGQFCNGAELCVGGACVAGADPCPGQLCDETLDTCVSCLADIDCDDGQFCTGAEACVSGECAVGFDPCPGQSCNEWLDACVECLAHADCSDGQYCNGQELCVGGACVAGADPCPGQSCNEALDTCVGCLSDADCDDGDACTDEFCDAGVCVNTSINCDDGSACTTDSCHPALGCLNEPLDCDDGDACTADSCHPTSGCLYDAVDCDDGDPCTADSCDPLAGCVHEPTDCGGDPPCTSHADCDDGDACTFDLCSMGSCLNLPIPDCADESCVSDGECDDGNACTEDFCDAGVCVNQSVSCDDGDACTTDTCHPSLGCLNQPISCDDSDLCTTDTCNPSVGCVHQAISCDDNNACTTDTCSSSLGCRYQSISCDDYDLCTTDACDPASGCSYQSISCDDGDPCTIDSCDAGVGCLHEPGGCDSFCGDANCDPAEDECNCPADCGAPPEWEFDCSDGLDEDCDGSADCDDEDCADDPACPACLSPGVSCTTDEECCSNKCKGKPGRRSCR